MFWKMQFIQSFKITTLDGICVYKTNYNLVIDIMFHTFYAI